MRAIKLRNLAIEMYVIYIIAQCMQPYYIFKDEPLLKYIYILVSVVQFTVVELEFPTSFRLITRKLYVVSGNRYSNVCLKLASKPELGSDMLGENVVCVGCCIFQYCTENICCDPLLDL